MTCRPSPARRLLLRFEYVTDGGLNTPGWAIDDVRIPEIGLSDDAETDGDWTANGFERLTGPIAQKFAVQVIEIGSQTNVSQVALDSANDATIDLRGPDQGVEKSIIVIAARARARAKRRPTSYSFCTRHRPAGLVACPANLYDWAG